VNTVITVGDSQQTLDFLPETMSGIATFVQILGLFSSVSIFWPTKFFARVTNNFYGSELTTEKL
jgi:hypothetical protein